MRQALAQASAHWSFRGIPGVATAHFSPCGTYRYQLRRVWSVEKPQLVVVGLNPSTADANKDDPTIRRVLGFAMDWGCGSILMMNLFAFRSTDPDRLDEVPAPIGPENDTLLRITFLQMREDRLLLAWGGDGTKFGRGALVASWARELHGKPECFGRTQDGQPLHPLYMPASRPTEAF